MIIELCILDYPVKFYVVDDGTDTFDYEGVYAQTEDKEQGKPVWKKIKTQISKDDDNVYFYYHGKYLLSPASVS